MSELFLAALKGELIKVRKLLDVSCINALHPEYCVTVLCFAIYSGNINVVKFLLDKGARAVTKKMSEPVIVAGAWLSLQLLNKQSKNLQDWWKKNIKAYIKKGDVTSFSSMNAKVNQRIMTDALFSLTKGFIDLNDIEMATALKQQLEKYSALITEKEPEDYRLMANCYLNFAMAIKQTNANEAMQHNLLALGEIYSYFKEGSTNEAGEWNEDLRLLGQCSMQVAELMVSKAHDTHYEQRYNLLALEWLARTRTCFEAIKNPDENDKKKLLKNYYLLSVFLKHEQKYDEAMDCLNKVVAGVSQLANPFEKDKLFQVYYMRGDVHARKHVRYLSQLSDMNNEEDPIHATSCHAYEEKAMASERQALVDFITAVNLFFQIEHKEPELIEQYFLCAKYLGGYWKKRKAHEQAIQYYDKYIAYAEPVKDKSHNEHHRLASMCYLVSECKAELMDFTAARSYVIKGNAWMRAGKEVNSSMLQYQGIAYAAYGEAMQGLVALIEGYVLLGRISDSNTEEATARVKINQSLYVGLLFSLMKAADKGFITPVYLIHQFIFHCLNGECADFLPAFNQLRSSLLLYPVYQRDNWEAAIVMYGQLLNVLTEAANEKNVFLTPALIGYLTNKEVILSHALLMQTLTFKMGVKTTMRFFEKEKENQRVPSKKRDVREMEGLHLPCKERT